MFCEGAEAFKFEEDVGKETEENSGRSTNFVACFTCFLLIVTASVGCSQIVCCGSFFRFYGTRTTVQAVCNLI